MGACRLKSITTTSGSYRELFGFKRSVDDGVALCIESSHLEGDPATFFVSARRVISLVQLANFVIGVRRGVDLWHHSPSFATSSNH